LTDYRYGIECAVLLVVYLLFLLATGLRFWRRGKTDTDEYLVMGRRLSLPAFVASIVSTWYGGILGVGEYSFRYGLSNWLVFGLPYYLAAALFAIFLAKKARRSYVYTIPDQLYNTYGRGVSLIGAFFVFITTVPAAYVLQVGVLANTAFGVPLTIGVIAGTFFSIIYIFSGGLRGDVFTDKAQFVMMFIGFIVLFVTLVINYGGLSFLQSHVPPTHFIWRGTNPASYIFVWYFIALATLVEPSFYQRCFAAESEKSARNGIFIAIAFWAMFDFLTTSTGIYARAILPELADPIAAYPALAVKVLPRALQAVFLLSLFATVMSTVDSYTFIAGTTLGKDIVQRLRGGDITFLSRIGLLASGALAIVIALYFKSVIDIWYIFGTLGTCAMLIPLASSFSPRWRMSKRMAAVAMITAPAIALIWIIPNLFWSVDYFWGIDPIYPGLAVSVIIYVLDKLLLNNTST
jgi:SSS family solute:Na+ symporter